MRVQFKLHRAAVIFFDLCGVAAVAIYYFVSKISKNLILVLIERFSVV